MSAMASQITGVSIVYSTVCWGADHRKQQKTAKLRVTGLCEGNSLVTSEVPLHTASNAENVSIWWRHHEMKMLVFRRCSGLLSQTPPLSVHAGSMLVSPCDCCMDRPKKLRFFIKNDLVYFIVICNLQCHANIFPTVTGTYWKQYTNKNIHAQQEISRCTNLGYCNVPITQNHSTGGAEKFHCCLAHSTEFGY